MEDLREAAIAYYNNCTEEQKDLARQFFQAMDVDGSGRVSLREYTDFLGKTADITKLFPRLDQNGDDQLDFWEVLTLHYMIQTKTVSCDACSQTLSCLYFTCVTCFESQCGDETFDLCIKCYKQKAYSHPHRVFLDSNVLLRSKRSHHPLQPASDDNLSLPESKKSGSSKAMKAFEVALTVGSAVTFCTIM